MNNKNGTYLDRRTGEYVLIFGGKKVGSYVDTGDEKRNSEIDRFFDCAAALFLLHENRYRARIITDQR